MQSCREFSHGDRGDRDERVMRPAGANDRRPAGKVSPGIRAEGNRGLEHGRDGGRASDRGSGGENAFAPSENDARTATSRAWWREAAVVSIQCPSWCAGGKGCSVEDTPATPIPAWALLIAGC